jgi:hypothetical protein
MAKKRGNGEGSISRRKNGGWMAQFAVYTAEGRKRKTLYGKTRQEVATKLARALSDREGGLIFDGGNQSVGEYMDRWLNDSLRDTVRQNTLELPSIGWQLFILGGSQSDSTAFLSSLVTYATRLLAEPLSSPKRRIP